jgi:hypothetical protein
MNEAECKSRAKPLHFVTIVLCAAGLLWGGITLVRYHRLETQKVRAHEQCQDLARAAWAYLYSPASWERKLDSLRDLAHPPYGTSSYLRYGEADLIDPWGQPFQMQLRQRHDGTVFAVITTTAPDGTPISQFGVGASSAERE